MIIALVGRTSGIQANAYTARGDRAYVGDRPSGTLPSGLQLNRLLKPNDRSAVSKSWASLANRSTKSAATFVAAKIEDVARRCEFAYSCTRSMNKE